MISEHDKSHPIYHAMLVFLVIIRRRKADVPFIKAITAIDYNDAGDHYQRKTRWC